MSDSFPTILKINISLRLDYSTFTTNKPSRIIYRQCLFLFCFFNGGMAVMYSVVWLTCHTVRLGFHSRIRNLVFIWSLSTRTRSQDGKPVMGIPAYKYLSALPFVKLQVTHTRERTYKTLHMYIYAEGPGTLING